MKFLLVAVVAGLAISCTSTSSKHDLYKSKIIKHIEHCLSSDACDTGKTFKLASNSKPIVFQNERVKINDDTIPSAGINCNEHLTTSASSKTISGYSCLFEHNKHNDTNKCGSPITYDQKSYFTAVFTAQKTLAQSLIFYCKIDYTEFEADSNYQATVTNFMEGDWKICETNRVLKIIPDENLFKVKFEYETRKDVDYRISVVAIDPAGSVSEIKKFDFASKNCALYAANNQKMYCGKNQWCTLDKRSPWANLADDKYKHRENDKCRYYNVAVRNFSDASSDYDRYGCGKTCEGGNSCDHHNPVNVPDGASPDSNGCCNRYGDYGCYHMLSINHFKVSCQKPACVSCGCIRYPDKNGNC